MVISSSLLMSRDDVIRNALSDMITHDDLMVHIPDDETIDCTIVF